MTNEKTITMCGKEVRLRYCAATENGFELMSGKKIYEIDFQSQEDLTRLAIASIIAAYERDGQDAPIEAKEILYDATPAEIVELFKTTMELRAAWYEVPLVLKEQIEAENAAAVSAASPSKSEEQPKNA